MAKSREERRARPRRHSWNRSQSEGFGPIRQVGIATSLGFPLLAVGVLMLAIAFTAGEAVYWAVAAGLIVGGVLAAASGRIT